MKRNSLDVARAIKHLKSADPVLAEAIARLPQPDIRNRRNYFRALVRSVISQQLSTKAARTIAKRFQQLFPGKTFPTPADVIRASDAELRGVGLSGGKTVYVKAIARAFLERAVKPRKFHAMSDEEIIADLTKIKGVGRWTAEMFLMFSLARPDVFSHGDLGLRKAIQLLYGFKSQPTLRQMDKITAKWSPHRTTASRYLWYSLDIKPEK